MGLKECQIYLDNQWNTYYPGQTITGYVEYTFDSLKKVRGICIKFKGECRTSWEGTETRRDHQDRSVTHTVAFSGEEEYFNTSYYLLGSKGGDSIEIAAGTHSYPFTCVLPPTLPSSFEGEHGYVRYTVKVTLDRPWKFDQETKMAFTVVSHMDLNMMPQCKEPLRIHMQKSFCCFCCKSGPLVVDVGLPVSGYCSGQGMPIDVSVENGSNVDVNEISIKLVKTVKFRTHVPRMEQKTSTVHIAQVTTDSVAGHSSNNFQRILNIPALPPSNLLNCSLIDLDYELQVTCNVEGCHMDLDDSRAVTIGTVPMVGLELPPHGLDTQIVSQDIPKEAAMYQPLLNRASPMPYPPPNGNQMSPNVYPPPSNPLPYPPASGLPPYPGQAPYPPAQSPYPNNPYSQQPPVNPSAPPMDFHTIPNMAQPVFQQSQFAAKTIQDANDNEHTKISGEVAFAPRYPMYGFTNVMGPPQ